MSNDPEFPVADPNPVREPFSAILSRRKFLQASGALGTAAMLPALAACSQSTPDKIGTGVDFSDLPLTVDVNQRVADGYSADVLIRWGDKLLPNAPDFDPNAQTAAAQEMQFGYNCDFVGYFPLPRGSNSSDHGLLVVNHEYTTLADMIPGLPFGFDVTPDMAKLDMAAHGASVVEIKKINGAWTVVPNSQYARRITVKTPMRISGPAAGHERMKTAADPEGRSVFGTFANCAGGKTPWGTVLTAEENFHRYFSNPPLETEPERGKLLSAGISGTRKNGWAQVEPRFDLTQEPKEANRFGWMVEFDPYDPKSQPVKRTALGRFRHEAGTVVINKDKRIVVYMGEDRPGGCVFRFVSKGTFDPTNPAAASALLDEGELQVARFSETKVTWIPLRPGQDKIPQEDTLADVVIDCYAAGSLAGGTPMDRPEDMETSPVTGRVYINLTNNEYRAIDAVNPANPRPYNEDGHIIEMIPPGEGANADHTAPEYAWTMFMLCGPEKTGAKYGPGTKTVLSCPDNMAFDPKGRLWIATDGWRWSSKEEPVPNGVYACSVDGPERASTRFFYNCPAGAEACGPEFTPDGETLFVAVQHPGEDTSKKDGKTWPDFKQGMPPRPSVIAIRRVKGGPIGG